MRAHDEGRGPDRVRRSPRPREDRGRRRAAVTDDGVLVRVRATSVNPADWHLMRGDPRIARLQMGLRRPKHTVLGCDVAGQVDAVGKRHAVRSRATRSSAARSCAGSAASPRCACVPGDCLAAKPANLSFEQAAAVPIAASTALQGLRDHGRVEPGHKVLIVGASGGVGTFAVQIAKSLGAEVTGVCSTPERRAGPVARRRPRRRLHAGGLRRERAALRRRPAGGGKRSPSGSGAC